MNIESAKGRFNMSVAMLKHMLQIVITYMIMAVTLFISSGRLNWILAWACLGASLWVMAVNVIVLPPELIAERGQSKGKIKRWDKVLSTLGSLATLGVLVLAGLDRRFGWSSRFILVIHLFGLIFFILGQGLFSWAMASNKFFSTVVHIQADRDHTVATTGPHRYVRHPGYVGYMVSFLGMSLALGSLWAIIPAGLITCFLIIRTILEDRELKDELPGYKDYACDVRYRMLLGIW